MEYSWELHIAAPRAGRWVVAGQSAGLHDQPGARQVGAAAARDVFEVLEDQAAWLRIDWPQQNQSAWLESRFVRLLKIAE